MFLMVWGSWGGWGWKLEGVVRSRGGEVAGSLGAPGPREFPVVEITEVGQRLMLVTVKTGWGRDWLPDVVEISGQCF